MNKRATELAELGWEVFSDRMAGQRVGPYTREEALIKAVAVMLSTPAPKKAKAPVVDAPKLPFTPRDVHQAFIQRCGELVVCYPVDHRAFAQLGAAMKQIEGLEAADLERLTGWVEAGGLSWWKGLPAFQNVVNNFAKWISTAREWDRRGRQNLRPGGSNVGSSTAQEDVGSRFK